ncbi:hypothetical protein [Veillonella sp.]|uniref:hypothetical protein n=1 Tax=Veillonella sp. TaxID=1926307 RepID=UPI00359FF645
MAEELNVNVTGINLPPIKVEGTLNIPTINLTGQNGKSAYEIWLEAGNTGTQEDFLNSLKGQNGADGRNGNNGLPGKDATADGAYEMLLGLNVYCENATPDEVLKGLIRGLGDAINKPFKHLEFDRPQKGQTYINVYGTPHFKVALLGKGAAFGVNIGDDGNGRLDLDSPFGGSDIELEYFNMLGNIVGTYRVSGYGDIKTELSRGDITDTIVEEINYPEVITVDSRALTNVLEVKRLILPKVRNIGSLAFNTGWEAELIKMPSYVFKYGSPLSNLTKLALGANIYLSEESDPNAIYIWNDMQLHGDINVYNGDGTKKVDLQTKTWVPVQ